MHHLNNKLNEIIRIEDDDIAKKSTNIYEIINRTFDDDHQDCKIFFSSYT